MYGTLHKYQVKKYNSISLSQAGWLILVLISSVFLDGPNVDLIRTTTPNRSYPFFSVERSVCTVLEKMLLFKKGDGFLIFWLTESVDLSAFKKCLKTAGHRYLFKKYCILFQCSNLNSSVLMGLRGHGRYLLRIW